MIPVVYDDGGRLAAGFRGKTRDCVVRSIAIVTGRPYAEIYRELMLAAEGERNGPRKSHPRTGVHTSRQWFKDYMQRLGFKWTPTMRVGTGCTTRLSASDLPMTGRHVVKVSRHVTALVDGELRDNHDPSRRGTRCVYGYWSL